MIARNYLSMIGDKFNTGLAENIIERIFGGIFIWTWILFWRRQEGAREEEDYWSLDK